jgi:hypothetical protein
MAEPPGEAKKPKLNSPPGHISAFQLTLLSRYWLPLCETISAPQICEISKLASKAKVQPLIRLEPVLRILAHPINAVSQSPMTSIFTSVETAPSALELWARTPKVRSIKNKACCEMRKKWLLNCTVLAP